MDSVPSSSAAQLQRFSSMPARGGSSISAPLRSPSVLLSRRSDMSGLGEIFLYIMLFIVRDFVCTFVCARASHGL